jgi:hypothetical protein
MSDRKAAICVGIAGIIWVLRNANTGEYLSMILGDWLMA